MSAWTAAAAAGGAVVGLLVVAAVIIFFLVCRMRLRYDTDCGELFLWLEAPFIKYRILPETPERARRKRIKKQKKQKKLEKKRKKAEKRAAVKKSLSDLGSDAEAASGINEKKLSVSERAARLADMIGKIASKIKAAAPGIADSLSLDIKRLDIVVGGEDAADAAIGYGAVCGAVEMLLAVGNESEKLTVDEDIFVAVDYGGEPLRAEIEIILNIRVYKALFAVMRAL